MAGKIGGVVMLVADFAFAFRQAESAEPVAKPPVVKLGEFSSSNSKHSSKERN